MRATTRILTESNGCHLPGLFLDSVWVSPARPLPPTTIPPHASVENSAHAARKLDPLRCAALSEAAGLSRTGERAQGRQGGEVGSSGVGGGDGGVGAGGGDGGAGVDMAEFVCRRWMDEESGKEGVCYKQVREGAGGGGVTGIETEKRQRQRHRQGQRQRGGRQTDRQTDR